MNVRIGKAAHHLHNRVYFADVTEELVTKSFARARPFYETGDADIGIDRAKRIIVGRGVVGPSDRIEQCRFPDIWQTDDSRAEHKTRTLRRWEQCRNERGKAKMKREQRAERGERSRRPRDAKV